MSQEETTPEVLSAISEPIPETSTKKTTNLSFSQELPKELGKVEVNATLKTPSLCQSCCSISLPSRGKLLSSY